jgi:hypothetical protein
VTTTTVSTGTQKLRVNLRDSGGAPHTLIDRSSGETLTAFMTIVHATIIMAFGLGVLVNPAPAGKGGRAAPIRYSCNHS